MQVALAEKGKSKTYIIAYGYEDKFELTEQEAQKIIEAALLGKKLVKFSNRVFSTHFSWIIPKEETKMKNLNSEELGLCEKVAEWISRPIHELDWPYEGALDYSKRLMGRVGYDEVNNLWREFANGAYPNVRRFLLEAKQKSDLNDPITTMNISMQLEGNIA